MYRVQIDASLREIEANGFTQFIFIADSGGSRTCELCKAFDGKTFSLKDGKVGVNLPPLHPNCRCSIAGHEDDEDFINWLENHGVELTDEDLEAMGLSRKESKETNVPVKSKELLPRINLSGKHENESSKLKWSALLTSSDTLENDLSFQEKIKDIFHDIKLNLKALFKGTDF